MQIKSAVKLGAVALASTFVLAACGSKTSDSAKKQSVNFMVASEIPTMDTSKVTDTIGLTQLANTEEGLYRLGKNSSVHNALATKTVVSKDKKTYTFTLRKNAKWSNGDKVTAKDFVYSWQRTVNPKTASEYAYLFSGIKNADKIAAGKVNYKTLGIKADGDYKLTVTLDRPVPYFKLLMGFALFFPQNQKAVEKYGSKYGTASNKLVYNGPYKSVGWTGTNLKWKLVKNPQYWNKKHIKMDTINYQVVKDASTALNLYNSKKLDVTTITGSQVAQYKNNKAYKLRKEASTFYLQLNEKRSYFKNKKIRQAVSMSIDRNQLTSKVLADGSQNPLGYVSAGLAENPKTGQDFAKEAQVKSAVTQNLTQAKKLLKEGLKEEGMSSLKFTLMADDTPAGKATNEFLQSQIEKLGSNVKVTVQNIPFKTRLTNSTNGKFDAVVTGWGADFADPISFLQLFVTGNSNNNGSWSNKEYDKLIKASSTTDANNEEKRWDDMVKAEKILMKDQGIVPIYQQAASQLWNTKLKGEVYNTSGINFDYSGLNLTE
ncbi:peptide ABC transporter substrate-binding protein [Pediococcus parvulus]|uniref:Peptide ABC transporter substrate-binding protein n=1 Tax=Pediococcus parvulus TaxID=54062 RepID=A0AAP5WBX2_9LACO|nr:peptide ABC transporter substrate-binding protein [Pediococcus parvulus]MDV7694673.1 peptide ABC transporter substrate-binding protein [Pediococcus parvulus]OAD63922.1 peptide ABC transporter substrate-binding protein [Pediococcus parvulus]